MIYIYTFIYFLCFLYYHAMNQHSTSPSERLPVSLFLEAFGSSVGNPALCQIDILKIVIGQASCE